MTDLTGNTPPKQNSKTNSRHIQPAVLVLIALIFLLMKTLSFLYLPRPAAYASDLTIENILNAVNKERGLRDLITLNTNFMLSSAAQSKSDDMQARHYFAHVDPDGNYIWLKIVAAGYTPYLQLGENLAIEFDSTDSLMAAWMNSPTHRANILNDGFKDQGMGLAFGNPNSGQYHSAITNTFGTLIAKKTEAVPSLKFPSPAVNGAGTKTPPPANKPTPKPTPPPAPKPVPPPSPVPSSTPTTTVSTPAQTQTAEETQSSLNPRGYAMSNDVPSEASANPPATSAPASLTTPSAPAVINSAAKNSDLNRYLILAFGVILLLFLLADLQTMIQTKFEHLDKKINNIVLLAVALVVIAFMYWL
jgi:uncharacterized protein YkwD